MVHINGVPGNPLQNNMASPVNERIVFLLAILCKLGKCRLLIYVNELVVWCWLAIWTPFLFGYFPIRRVCKAFGCNAFVHVLAILANKMHQTFI
jgi:hypothetical protein